MIEKIICGSYSEAMSMIIQRIKNRKPDLDVKTVLLVPDNYTLYAEKKLCEGNSGFFDVDVVSFNRLFFRLCDCKPLGKEQAVMLLRTIVTQLKLECFVKSSRYRGFAVKLYDAIMQLKKNGITPEELKKLSSPKWRDIAAIYEKYLEKSADFADLSGRVRLLKTIAENGYFAGCNVYAVNFDLLTGDESDLLEIISRTANNFVFGSVIPQTSLDGISAAVEVMDCNGSAEQLKEIAVRISDAAYRGIKYSDMCVVCSGDCREHIQRIFGEYSIPYYFDYKYKFSDHPLPRYITSVFNAIKRNLRRKDVMELVKNPYFNADKSESDIFEIFCERFCIDFKDFENSFVGYDSEYTQVAEKIRKRLIGVINRARKLGKKNISSEDFCLYISEIAAEAEATGKEFDSSLGIDSSKELIKAAEFISSITDNADFELLTEIFADGIGAVEISTLPNLSGSVIVGDVSTFRGQRFEYMFVTDFNEGVLPRISEESGIISDFDIVSSGLKLTTSDETNVRHRSELIMLLSSAKKLFVTCEKNAPGGRSTFLKALMLKKKVIPYTRNDELDALYNDSEFLPVLAGSKPAAEELLLGAVSDYALFAERRGNVRDFAFPLYAALGDEIQEYFPSESEPSLPEKLATRLFSESPLSVSRISGFYKCPYMHFIKYGLKAKQWETAEIRANDVGDILHRVAELFVRFYKGGDIRDEVISLTEKVIEEHNKKQLIKNPSSYKFLLDEAERGCRTLYSHFSAGDFTSPGEEVRFGNKGTRFIGPSFDFGNGRIYLCGSIDYMDVWKNYARIVDYKTGLNAKFDIGEIFYGLNLQLPLYASVLKLNGYDPAGMFLFPFRIKWSTDDDGLRLDGIFDKELLKNIDRGFDGKGEFKSSVVKAQTKVLKSGEERLYSSSAVTPELLNAVISYAEALAAEAAKLMSRGFICSKPYNYKGRTPCSYCDCKSICLYRESEGFRALSAKKIENFSEVNRELDA